MKKAFLCALSLALLLSAVSGCAQKQSPAEAGTDQAQPVRQEDPQETADPQPQPQAQAQQSADRLKEDSGAGGGPDERPVVSDGRLAEIFEAAYQMGKVLREIDPDAADEELLEKELIDITFETGPDERLPDDYEEQYRAWRAERAASEVPAQPQDAPSNGGSASGGKGTASPGTSYSQNDDVYDGNETYADTSKAPLPPQKGVTYAEPNPDGGYQDPSDDVGTEELDPWFIEWFRTHHVTVEG